MAKSNNKKRNLIILGAVVVLAFVGVGLFNFVSGLIPKGSYLADLKVTDVTDTTITYSLIGSPSPLALPGLVADHGIQEKYVLLKRPSKPEGYTDRISVSVEATDEECAIWGMKLPAYGDTQLVGDELCLVPGIPPYSADIKEKSGHFTDSPVHWTKISSDAEVFVIENTMRIDCGSIQIPMNVVGWNGYFINVKVNGTNELGYTIEQYNSAGSCNYKGYVILGKLSNVSDPADCPSEINYVCGKDGITYDNECKMVAAGTTLDYAGECCSATFDFSEDNFYTLESDIVTQSDPERDECVYTYNPALSSNTLRMTDAEYNNLIQAEKATPMGVIIAIIGSVLVVGGGSFMLFRRKFK